MGQINERTCGHSMVDSSLNQNHDQQLCLDEISYEFETRSHMVINWVIRSNFVVEFCLLIQVSDSVPSWPSYLLSFYRSISSL